PLKIFSSSYRLKHEITKPSVYRVVLFRDMHLMDAKEYKEGPEKDEPEVVSLPDWAALLRKLAHILLLFMELLTLTDT
ncbi:hypothetical protein HHI36_010197, partial [Cryptolaemus montrouzieri]